MDQAEVAQFAQRAAQWWDQTGDFAPLHKFTPCRMEYIRNRICDHFNRTRSDDLPLDGLRILDVGCGGGLICEPLTRLGARVTGIDAAPENIAAAAEHAGLSGLDIDYRSVTLDQISKAQDSEKFDVVLSLEVIEHVADPAGFLADCAGAVRPGGLMITSTINRTVKSFLLAIVGAEYILGWLPRGTHRWERFVTADEMTYALGQAGLSLVDMTGVSYSPLGDKWTLSGDLMVNYMATAARSYMATAARSVD